MVKKRRNRFCQLFGIMVCLFLIFISASEVCIAKDTEDKGQAAVIDDASLLTEGEAGRLQDAGENLAQKSGWNIIAATCEKASGRTAQRTCEDYFNTYTTGDDGISCLIDMANREIYLSTAGDAILYLNDRRIDKILDKAYEAVSEGDYEKCLYLMISGAEEAYESGVPDNAVIFDEDTGETRINRKLTTMEILIALIAACSVGGIVFAGILGRYRLKWGTYQYDFHNFGSLILEKKEDRFVNQAVTQRKLPQSNGASGGSRNRSTVHTGSGGRKFGGGGRKF